MAFLPEPRTAPGTNSRAGRVARSCPVCSADHLSYLFLVDGHPLQRCEACTFVFLNPQPERTSMVPTVTAGGVEPRALYDIHATNAVTRLDQLVAYAGSATRLLLIADDSFLADEAKRRGLDVLIVSTGDIEHGRLSELTGETFDAVAFACTLERLSDPADVLKQVAKRLTPTGAVMVIAPTLDSRTARLFRSAWWELRPANLHYFTADTLQSLLVKSGFGDLIIDHDDAVVSLEHLRTKLPAVSSTMLRSLLSVLISVTPRPLRHRAFRFLNSRRVVFARPRVRGPQPRLSVIVPAYNERATFSVLMERLLAKSIEGLDIEIVLVESNSSDGTRDEAIEYGRHPRVQLILEDKPSGKGHAVRRGLAACTGDIVLFQDADLEYDINDYDGLVAPLIAYQRNFVIGSRHSVGTVWKIRQFNDAMALASVFNFGHVVFLTLLNTMYRQRLKDPFSMFKVFRRECLYGLTFECNRFDFDFEIVIKLLRKGYQPLELPVNYYARSPAEGKKVTMIRDPLTWMRALVKFRWSRLYRWTARS